MWNQVIKSYIYIPKTTQLPSWFWNFIAPALLSSSINMWHVEGTRHFRACIASIKLNSLRSTYFLEWDSKVGNAIPKKSSSRQYRAFQSFTLISTLIVQPIFFLRCYQISKSPPGSVTLIAYYINVIGTILALVALPLLWFFAKESNLQKFVTCFHEVLNLDKRFYGKFISPAFLIGSQLNSLKSWLRDKVSFRIAEFPQIGFGTFGIYNVSFSK